MTKFEVGKTYSQCHIGDSELFSHFIVLARTAKTVTVQSHSKIMRRGLSVYNDVEQFKPFGSYSMCMIVGADKRDRTQAKA